MAGKHFDCTVSRSTSTAAFRANIDAAPPVYPGSKIDRAYAEGRQNVANGNGITGNPHPTGTPERVAWTNGAFTAFDSVNFLGTQYMTAVGDNSAP